MNLQAALTLLLGMLLGWAWGCLGMAAGVAARSSTLLVSQYQRVAQDIGNNPDATTASYVFQGVFLDTRSDSSDSSCQPATRTALSLLLTTCRSTADQVQYSASSSSSGVLPWVLSEPISPNSLSCPSLLLAALRPVLTSHCHPLIRSIFGTIVADIMFSYGPLFPTHQFMLASTFLIPTSSYVAIALVGLAVIFPESMSHVWL